MINNPTKKYLVTIEFRYSDAPVSEQDGGHRSKKVTVGVFDDMEAAHENANKVLEVLESKFELNPNTARRERFSKNGGWFGRPTNLVTNLGYLRTPFEFFLKVITLNFDSVENTIGEILEAVERYRDFEPED